MVTDGASPPEKDPLESTEVGVEVAMLWSPPHLLLYFLLVPITTLQHMVQLEKTATSK